MTAWAGGCRRVFFALPGGLLLFCVHFAAFRSSNMGAGMQEEALLYGLLTQQW